MDRQKSRKTDRQKDITKLMVAFRIFSNAPKNVHTYRTDEGRDVSHRCADSGSKVTTVYSAILSSTYTINANQV
jgi:hypothetical protein